MGRSARYPTHYRIGVLNRKDVYCNPQEGLAIEREGCLVEMTFGERCAVGESLLAEEDDGPDYSEHPSCVTRNVRLGLEE